MQPSEFFEIALLLVVSSIAHLHNLHIQERTSGTGILLICKVMLVTLIPSIFVYQQPDSGMVILYLVGSITVLFYPVFKGRSLRQRWLFQLLEPRF
ncbi:hypothetical protein [Lysinibacillus sp. 3P01SB]|uniref:hypothetical protein n=1 Tax=Lysinibacillus sp. 3P01SB TaxID=3132284 RepID=UPI0039A5CA12